MNIAATLYKIIVAMSQNIAFKRKALLLHIQDIQNSDSRLWNRLLSLKHFLIFLSQARQALEQHFKLGRYSVIILSFDIVELDRLEWHW
jgi:hypothetical protein